MFRQRSRRRTSRHVKQLHLALERLEPRQLLSATMDLGSLRFYTAGSDLGTGLVQMGLLPGSDNIYTPLVEFQNGVTFDTGAGTFTTDGNVTTVGNSPQTLMSGPHTFAASDVTGSGGASLSSGAAALMLAMVLNKKNPAEKHEIKFLVTLDVVFISLELFIILPYLIHGQLSSLAVKQALSLILGGPYTFVFWGPFLVMGLLVPLAIEVYELAPNIFKGHEFHGSRNLALTAASLVLIGGFLLRYIFVYAGQVSSFHQMGLLH